jgi:hypothetical protein
MFIVKNAVLLVFVKIVVMLKGLKETQPPQAILVTNVLGEL